MTSVIITFKKFPELGRLRVVSDEIRSESCGICALENHPCSALDKSTEQCGGKNSYHYERVKDSD